MSFRENETQQISLSDSVNNLTEREKALLKRTWAENFSKMIFPCINEKPFAVLYSENNNSRPNTPVNVVIGALILKEMFNLTDGELMSTLTFDVRFQYALNTTSYEEQPTAQRTLSRFRAKIFKHFMETKEDLLENEMKRLANEFAKLMSIEPTLKRMDSLMVSTNARIMGRLELIYTCTEMMVKLIQRTVGIEFLTTDLIKYLEDSNHNVVCYHTKDEQSETRIEKALADAVEVFLLCGEEYAEFTEYKHLKRMLEEQTKMENGKYILKNNKELSAKNMQTPHDDEATYRKKAGKKYVGYVANVVESVGENGSIITDFDVAPNVYSDVEFAKDEIAKLGKQKEQSIIVTDGAYASDEIIELAQENNIELITTSLTGKPTDEIVLEFDINEEENKILSCPIGEEPIEQKYNEEKEEYTCRFDNERCGNCPNRERCRTVIQKKSAKVVVNKKQVRRAKHQKSLAEGAYKKYAAIRNGVEGIPSILRRRYNVDNIPVFNLARLKMWFSLKIGAINAKKFLVFAN